jgi:hypothetical protein
MAANGVRIEVYGVAEAIKELRNLEPELYKRIVKDLKTSSKPLAKAVGLEFPDEPLVNWEGDGSRNSRGFPTYNTRQAQTRVTAGVITSIRKGRNEHGILRLQQMSPSGAIYDSAGSKTAASKTTDGGRFIMNLDKRLPTKSSKGSRSRVMYPKTKKHLPKLIPAIQESVSRTEAAVQRTINKGVL